MNSASTNLVKQLIGPENRLDFHRYILGPIFLLTGEHWIESSKFNLCFLRKRWKWKMLSDTKRMLLFSPLRSLGLISNAYCYTLFPSILH